jgi:recombination protein RecA
VEGPAPLLDVEADRPRAKPLPRGVVRGRELDAAEPLDGLPRGAVLELRRGADTHATTAAALAVAEVQREGDPALWCVEAGTSLFPPDLVAAGVDLAALVVVHVPDDGEADARGLARAAELALRTGAFGAVLVDVERRPLPRGEGWVGRLAGLAREHDCRVLLLTPETGRGAGPLAPYRLAAAVRRRGPSRFHLETRVLKSKTGLRPRLPEGELRGPEGLP